MLSRDLASSQQSTHSLPPIKQPKFLASLSFDLETTKLGALLKPFLPVGIAVLRTVCGGALVIWSLAV